jgi:hypothetical protein
LTFELILWVFPDIGEQVLTNGAAPRISLLPSKLWVSAESARSRFCRTMLAVFAEIMPAAKLLK